MRVAARAATARVLEPADGAGDEGEALEQRRAKGTARVVLEGFVEVVQELLGERRVGNGRLGIGHLGVKDAHSA